MALDYLFLADGGSEGQVELRTESFNALTEQNDYEVRSQAYSRQSWQAFIYSRVTQIPWALRDLIADDRVSQLFSEELVGLREAFRDWHPKTAILREVKRKLQPIQRLSVDMMNARGYSMSKL